jgi:hypothetical protein
MNKDIVQVSPQRLTNTIRETSGILLDYFEESGYHQQEEITSFLILLSKLDFINGEFLVDFAAYSDKED